MQPAMKAIVPGGQAIVSCAPVFPPTRSALRARGTAPSRASTMRDPPSVLRLSFLPLIVRSLICEPLIRNAAYELPPRAMNTAMVAITLAYVRRRRRRASIEPPFAFWFI
jgi:hypothetical protein